MAPKQVDAKPTYNFVQNYSISSPKLSPKINLKSFPMVVKYPLINFLKFLQLSLQSFMNLILAVSRNSAIISHGSFSWYLIYDTLKTTFSEPLLP